MIDWSWTCVKVAAKDIGDATATTTTASKNETSIAIWRPLEAKVQSQLQLKLLLSTSSSHDVINDLKNGAGNGSSSISSQCGGIEPIKIARKGCFAAVFYDMY